jgi:hypothetical protein
VVRLYLSSALNRLPLEQRWGLGESLIGHGEDAEDHNLPLMYWYGVEPLAGADQGRFLKLAGKSKIPRVREFITRRIASK